MKRVSWFASLGSLIVLNIFFGYLAGESAKQAIFMVLILLLAISTLALLVFDRFKRSSATKGTDDLAQVQRAMEEEFKNHR